MMVALITEASVCYNDFYEDFCSGPCYRWWCLLLLMTLLLCVDNYPASNKITFVKICMKIATMMLAEVLVIDNMMQYHNACFCWWRCCCCVENYPWSKKDWIYFSYITTRKITKLTKRGRVGLVWRRYYQYKSCLSVTMELQDSRQQEGASPSHWKLTLVISLECLITSSLEMNRKTSNTQKAP